ncbi:threonine synthase [Halobacillus salinarum]|uniref:Threonine synthase n=1 Tax=Halobacillus salinarum TaxID=2932257 RepID=A0ABY4EJE0_9BACI|nr:threonine synthase [Halobacillus salinarum]UOQ43968.1 threonine synthase [Halobacillus salinarum]
MDYTFIDSADGVEYIPNQTQWKPEQGIFNIKPYKVQFPREKIALRSWTMWRYKEALPFHDQRCFNISLGEGGTPLLPLNADDPNILVKLDYLMPTGSFKDRGAAVLISKARELGVKEVLADSSGNAGTAIAAYCARAGIKSYIYVPENTSERKLAQMKAYGAEIHKIAGSREDTAIAAKRTVEEEQLFYASHVYNPFFHEGTKTFAFEIWEQMNYQIPDQLILPVGNGTLLLGAYIGFQNLLESGMIQRLPKLVGVQAENCAPIAQAFHRKRDINPVSNTGTLAEGIAIADPVRGSQIMKAVKTTGGSIITARENEIETARGELSSKGFYVEPTTAATYAAFKNYKQANLSKEAKVVMSLCGSGLKK